MYVIEISNGGKAMKKAIQIEYNESFELKCHIASEVGFSDIAVNYTKVLGKSEDDWKKITEDILRILDETGLSCVQSHPHYYNPFESSEIIDDEMEYNIRQSIVSSAALGAKWCVIHPRTSFSSGFLLSKSFEDNKKWFSALLECAEKHGTGIAAENLPIFPSPNPIRPLFSYNVEHLTGLLDSFNCDNIGVCWDFGHANLLRGDQVPMLKALGERIKCTHIHNNWGMRDNHAPPIYGNINWSAVMPALAKTGYHGPLTLETHCWYDDEALLRSFAKHNYENLEYLERLMK